MPTIPTLHSQLENRSALRALPKPTPSGNLSPTPIKVSIVDERSSPETFCLASFSRNSSTSLDNRPAIRTRTKSKQSSPIAIARHTFTECGADRKRTHAGIAKTIKSAMPTRNVEDSERTPTRIPRNAKHTLGRERLVCRQNRMDGTR